MEDNKRGKRTGGHKMFRGFLIENLKTINRFRKLLRGLQCKNKKNLHLCTIDSSELMASDITPKELNMIPYNNNTTRRITSKGKPEPRR